MAAAPGRAHALSRPSRARGLKLLFGIAGDQVLLVAPFTGAWIETAAAVASPPTAVASRPSRARGLKPDVAPEPLPVRPVAPFTGAWIETHKPTCRQRHQTSRPSRARGLKRCIDTGIHILSRSRPSRARGLKQMPRPTSTIHAWSRPSRARGLKQAEVEPSHQRLFVAPFTGAWIETRVRQCRYCEGESRPSRARGLKLVRPVRLCAPDRSRPSRARGLKLAIRQLAGLPLVAPFTGAWIET